METYSDIFLEGLKKVSEESYFKKLAETMPNKLIIADAESFRIQYSNQYKPEIMTDQVIGRKLFDFINPEHVDVFKEKLQEVISTHKPVTVELEGVSYTNKEGKAWYRTHITALKDTDGKLQSFLFLSEDITELKRKELDAINKTERIKAIFNNTNDIICSIDLEYNVTEFNEIFAGMIKKAFSIDLEIGMPVLNFIDPTKHAKLKELYSRVSKGEVLVDVEEFATANGSVFNETNYHPIYNFNKEIIGINIFSKDITNRKRNEEKIQNALREKEVLLSEIHHRIKNNLAIVTSMLQLQEMNMTSDEAKEALRLSRNRIKSTALVHELLYQNESFHNISLNDYLLELFNRLKPDNNKTLVYSGNDVSMNLTYAMPFGLLLNELLLNTFKHAYRGDESGEIKIHCSVNDHVLSLEYIESKGGFPEHVNFYEPKTTGLLLIHTFAQQLDGEINLIQTAPPKYLITIPFNE